MTGARVLVVGLDGAAPSFLHHWAKEGILPFLGGLLADGASGVLRSTVPPYTPTAWTSIVTGVNPGRHGVFGFTRLGADGRESLVDSGVCRIKPVWELLAERGRPSVVVNVPITYPPRDLDGVVLVSGMGTPPDAARIAAPAGVDETIRQIAPGYVPDVAVREAVRGSAREAREAVSDVARATEARVEVAGHLLDRFPWEFAMVVLEAPDRLQHLFWKAIEPGAPPTRERDRILAVYRRLDEGVGRLVEGARAAGPLVVLVVSDHGFQPLDWLLSLNVHLERRGLLALRPGLTAVRAARALPSPLRRLAARAAGRVRRGPLEAGAAGSVDWDRTRAFAGRVFEQGVYVRDGRPETRAEVLEALTGLAGPGGRGPAVRDVATREEIYSGPAVSEAPDLFPRFRLSGVMIVPRVNTRNLWERVDAPQGTHHEDGVLVAVGPGIEPTAGVAARAEDVAPTVLALLGGPVPRGLDGRPVPGVAPAGVPHADVALEREGGGDRAAEPSAYSAREEAEVVERLRGLGYFD